MFQISGDVIRALGLKMKILMTVIFGGLLIGSVILLSFSHNFNDQLLDATSNDQLLAATINGKLTTKHNKIINLLGIFFTSIVSFSCDY